MQTHFGHKDGDYLFLVHYARIFVLKSSKSRSVFDYTQDGIKTFISATGFAQRHIEHKHSHYITSNKLFFIKSKTIHYPRKTAHLQLRNYAQTTKSGSVLPSFI